MSQILLRRRAALGVLAWALLPASPAWGGTYLNRAALLISGALREGAYLRARFSDRELARVTHRMAQARLDAAREMAVPKEVVLVHPHLLLVLVSFVQAAEAATRGDVEAFLQFHQKALDEERTFRTVLKQHGWVLPD
jgi:hypothetical protein